MVFSSHIFLFYFLPIVLGSYYLLPRRGKNIFMTLASYLFYSWSNPQFTLLMIFSTAVDYSCGLVIGKYSNKEHAGYRKTALVISIITNLSLLGVFKYMHFALDNYNVLMTTMGLGGLGIETSLRFILPLGISFYTFQSMSYTIDVYRGEAKHITNITDFACYVSMFPQLVAGPIIRFQEVANQLASRDHTIEKFSRGVSFFALGMAKKVLLANSCGKVADLAFDAGVLHWLDAWYGAVAYAFQIYFDFSGYSDMAIGLGLMFGFVFPKNFDSPYLSKSITEFWRRWHISLSTWLREYLYIPLGGNRKGGLRTSFNLLMVMFLGGLWHGAAWNFVVWGLFHGAILGLERSNGKKTYYHMLPGALRTGITFVLILISWVFFRADTLSASMRYLASMFQFATPLEGSFLIRGIIYQPYYVVSMLTAAVIVWAAPQTWDWTGKLTAPKIFVILIALLVSIFMLTLQSYNPFIYFNF